MTTTERTETWNSRHRAEGPLNRADRNFAELLQELRVVFTGVQILFGFLLTLAFNDRIRTLDVFQHALFTTTLCSAAVSSMVIVAPVAAHRLLFQRNRKRELVQAGHRLALAGLGLLALTLCSGTLLVLDMTVGRAGAIAGTAVLLAVTVSLWVVLPLHIRGPARAAATLPEPRRVP